MSDTEKTYTLQEVCGELAKTIKAKVDTFAGEVKTLRERELQKRGGKRLGKTELCPLCGNPDRPGVCTCNLRKGGMLNAAPDAPPAAPVLGMAEKGLGKAELCKTCGYEHMPGEHKVKKDEKDATTKFKSPIAPVKGSKLPGDSKPKVVDAGDDSGDIRKGKSLKKAVAGAVAGPAKVPGTPGKQPIGQGGGDAHKVPAPTPVAQANKELAGAKSVASSPTAMPTGSTPTMGVGARMAATKASTIPTGKPLQKPPGAAGGLPGPLQGVRDSLNLASDMKAGGVGWLQRKRAAGAPAPTPSAPPAGGSPFGPTSKRATGIATSQAALARGEMSTGYGAKVGITTDQRSKASQQKDFTSNRAPSKAVPKAQKTEVPAPTAGLNSVNHNRRLLG